MKRETSGKGLVLYQQVLQKNFQIIQTFLNKFPVIFKKQDHFEQAIKKINQKLVKFDSEHDKIRQNIEMTANLLDKKISHLKENASKIGRGSRGSQDIMPFEERKSSIFKINASVRESREQQTAIFSKQKMELLNEMDKKQQQSNKKIQQLQIIINQFQQKMNFISVMNGKFDQDIDRLIDCKVDKVNFQRLESQYESKFNKMISKLAEEGFQMHSKLIDQQITLIKQNFQRDINKELSDVRRELFGELEKKAVASELRDELKELKDVIQKMVEESVESFASKDETKMALILFEKKFTKLQLVMEEMFQNSLKATEEETTQGAFLGFRKEKEGIMGGFGRKRRTGQK